MLILFLTALFLSSLGFKKYIWFISIGYGLSIAGIGLGLILLKGTDADAGVIAACVLFIVYGIRLGGYLAMRERNGSYNKKMKGETKPDEHISMIHKIIIWITAALLYVCQSSPLIFRMINERGSDPVFITGFVISIAGLMIESTADIEKSAAKKKDPSRFVDTGLYRIVRCPNYFGEMLFWTGVFTGGTTALSGILQWICAISGYLGIIYVMFSGARRLELRQNRTYGNDPAYLEYAKTTPIMIPLIPLYSVEKHKWLVG